MIGETRATRKARKVKRAKKTRRPMVFKEGLPFEIKIITHLSSSPPYNLYLYVSNNASTHKNGYSSQIPILNLQKE